jgi:hypothetical protein
MEQAAAQALADVIPPGDLQKDYIIPDALARIIHEGFYCNRRYAAATSLTAGGLAAQSVNVLLRVRLPPSRRSAGYPLRLCCNGCNA